MAFLFTRKNYHPVKDLMKLLENKAAGRNVKTNNEFKVLYEAVNHTLDENVAYSRKIKQDKRVLKSVFLNKILNGRIDNEELFKSGMAKYDMECDSDYYAVLLFYIKDFSKLFEGDDCHRCRDDKVQLVNFIVHNIVEEMVSQNNFGYMTEINEVLACIINFKKENLSGEKQEILRIANESKEFLVSLFKIEFIVASSSLHQGFYGIPAAYQEALNVMDYKLTTEKYEVVFYDEIREPKGNYNYSIETEHQLINYIKTGNFEGAQTIIQHLFDANFSEGPFSLELVKCFMFDLVGTMLKTLPEINFAGDSSFFEGLDVFQRLLSCETILEMKRQILEIMETVCVYIQQNKKPRKDDFIGKVVEYIQENYCNQDISVSSIADKFSITPQYLSKIFSEQIDEGIFDFITKLRMDKAKALLKDQQLSIKDIAMEVGYIYSSAFIRAFKKHEGVTPGIYKGIEYPEA